MAMLNEKELSFELIEVSFDHFTVFHSVMAHLHYQIPIPILIHTANQMAIFYYVEHFILHGVRLWFQSQLPSTGIESES